MDGYSIRLVVAISIIISIKRINFVMIMNLIVGITLYRKCL